MRIRIKYRTVSGRVEEIVVEAASASGGVGAGAEHGA